MKIYKDVNFLSLVTSDNQDKEFQQLGELDAKKAAKDLGIYEAPGKKGDKHNKSKEMII